MKPAPGATRKWARQVRWHERASQAASAAGAVQQPDQAPAAAKSSMNSTLLAAMQQQQRTDRCRARVRPSLQLLRLVTGNLITVHQRCLPPALHLNTASCMQY